MAPGVCTIEELTDAVNVHGKHAHGQGFPKGISREDVGKMAKDA